MYLPKAKLANVQLIINGNVKDFDQNRRQDVIVILAQLLNIEKDDIRILEVIQGSVILKIVLPETATTMLEDLAHSNNIGLIKLGIQSVQIGSTDVINITGFVPLPPGSNIPFPRNTLFTGREKDLDLLAESLLGDKPSATLISQAITGMGGIGKTQLAVEFAYRYGYKFDGVHWLNLANPESLDSEIAACGRLMGLTYDDQREQVANTMKLWQSGGLRLLILDNFEEINEANEVLARLQGAKMRLLITSHRRDWSKALGLQQLPLDLFSEKESLDFLGSALERSEDEEDKKALANKLGYLPLALERAAKYINVNGISIAAYIKDLNEVLSHESMDAEWFKSLDITTPTKHELSLLGTFRLSWEQAKDETEQNVFRAAGYCAPNTPIPLEIFAKALELDDKQIHKALYRLNALGLLQLADDAPTVPPLLAAYARVLNDKHELLEKLAHALAVLASQAYGQVKQTGSLGRFAPFRYHVFSVGEHAEKANLQVAADLFGNLGNYLETVAEYTGAKSAFERVLKIDEIAFGPNHPRIALCLNNLGGVLQALGDLNGAKANFERALKIDEAAFGPDHPKVAIDVNNLGGVLQALGDLNGARVSFERALKIDEAALGLDHPQVAIDVNNLGGVLQALGDLNGAKANFERALKIDETAFGPDHPKVATSVNNLGFLLQELGDLQGAKANYERALKIFEKQLGKKHPNVATLVNNMGMVLQALGDLNGAKANIERALKIDETAFGPDHPDVARDVYNLGLVLQELGDLNGAKGNYERAQKILRKFLPEEHPKIKLVEGNLKALEK